ncbi:AN1-type zinc finger domain-containing protein [Halobellus inordinatus]|uniref:AN1-type zinc finger domain-containing protein n=1 Tax=Halobellus inordinatus TaxID=1126236 RepID=UPI0034E0C334
MTESLCLVCGSETAVNGMAYRCAYCGEPVCSEHRLPENHGCTGSQLPDDESAKGREAKPMRLSNDQTVGTTPTDTGQSSPDVALDGSVVGEESEKDESESPSWWKRLIPW